jgi:hypothetical protein
MFSIREIDIRDVVDDLPVYFLGHVLIEASVARFHVEDGNFEALRGDRAQGGIRIAEDEERIGFFFHKQFVRSRNDVPHGLAEIAADNIEVAVGSPQVKVLEEYFVERVVPVLSRVDKDSSKLLSQARITSESRIISGRVPIMVIILSLSFIQTSSL